MRGYMIFLLVFLIDGVFRAGAEVKPEYVSVKESDSVTLTTGVTKNHDDIMLWYFNEIRIVQINGEPSKICLYDGEGGGFRDRLKVNNETGNLTITDIQPEHAGLYEAEHIRSKGTGTTTSLNRSIKCNSTQIFRKSRYSNSTDETIKLFNVTVIGSAPSADSALSAGGVAGIVVGVLLFGAVGVICYCQRILKKTGYHQQMELSNMH